jgi:hypothetical protein
VLLSLLGTWHCGDASHTLLNLTIAAAAALSYFLRKTIMADGKVCLSLLGTWNGGDALTCIST